jgi:galactonate dehydratase
MGKALVLPVYPLMGGAVRKPIKAYANDWYMVEHTPEEFHAAAKRVLEKGYRSLKFDPFGSGFYELDKAEKRQVIETVEDVYEAVGPDIEILIEMHGRFNVVAAVEMAHAFERFNPFWIEEPVPPENLAGLKKASSDPRVHPHALRLPPTL